VDWGCSCKRLPDSKQTLPDSRVQTSVYKFDGLKKTDRADSDFFHRISDEEYRFYVNSVDI
jgi:hypothetical protein